MVDNNPHDASSCNKRRGQGIDENCSNAVAPSCNDGARISFLLRLWAREHQLLRSKSNRVVSVVTSARRLECKLYCSGTASGGCFLKAPPARSPGPPSSFEFKPRRRRFMLISTVFAPGVAPWVWESDSGLERAVRCV